MEDTSILFRLIAASTLVGLLAYCVAHVFQVWRKRNARPAGDRTPVGRRLAWACLVAGAVLIPAAAVNRELTRGEGVLTGEGLFVVRASDDMTVEYLRDGDEVAAGETLARFRSGPRSTRAEEIQALLARAESDRDVLELLPLAPDPDLTRRHQALTQERTQAQQELGQAVLAADASDRDLTAQLFAKKEVLTRLELTLTERRKDLDRATLRLTHARNLLATYGKIAGGVSAVEYQEQVKVSGDAEIEVAALTQEVKDLLTQRDVFRGQVDSLEAARSNPASPLRKLIADLTARVARLGAEAGELKPKIDQDLIRSAKLREAEKAQVAAKVREHRASLDGLNRELEVRAPFAGRLAYRTASPNATPQRGTLAVLAPAEGFLLTARMSQPDADALRESGEVMIAVGEGSAERRIPARFRQSAALAHEPGYATVQLECQPPPEMTRRLAEGEKQTVPFAWHPPLAAMWPFRAGVVLFAAGVVGLVLTSLFKGGTGVRRGGVPHTVSPPSIEHVATRQPVAVTTVELPGEMPETYEEAEACYRETLADLKSAANAQLAAALLKRLRRLREIQRSLNPHATSDRYDHLRQVLRSFEAPIDRASDARSGALGRS